MTLLATIEGPQDLKTLSGPELDELADDIRTFPVRTVAGTGGHLGPDLGVVELSIALHRAFDSPVDRILWDTGHQNYVHELLTGRQVRAEVLADIGLTPVEIAGGIGAAFAGRAAPARQDTADGTLRGAAKESGV